MSEKAPPTPDETAKALSRANSVQPGKPAGEMPQPDPAPVPPSVEKAPG